MTISMRIHSVCSEEGAIKVHNKVLSDFLCHLVSFDLINKEKKYSDCPSRSYNVLPMMFRKNYMASGDGITDYIAVEHLPSHEYIVTPNFVHRLLGSQLLFADSLFYLCKVCQCCIFSLFLARPPSGPNNPTSRPVSTSGVLEYGGRESSARYNYRLYGEVDKASGSEN